MADTLFLSFNSLMKSIYIGMDFEDILDYSSSYGCDVNHLDSTRNTSLTYAISSKDINKNQIINLLLDLDANPNIRNIEGNTPFMIACSEKGINDDTFKRLVRNSNLEMRDIEDDLTPLEYCIVAEVVPLRRKKIQFMLDEGAVLSYKIFFSFIREASETYSNEIFDIMKNFYDFLDSDQNDNIILIPASFKAGIDCNFYIFENILKLTKLADENAINKTNKFGETALINAALGVASGTCIYKTVELLLEYGAVENIKDKKGYTYKDYLPDKFKNLVLPRKKFFSDEPKKECTICCDIKDELIYFENCGHGTICEECFEKNITMCQGTCHKCRAEITNVRIFRYVK